MKTWKKISDLSKKISVNVPNGESGDWTVSTFTVSKEDEAMGMMRAAISSSSRGRYVPAGTYKALKRDGETIMSNTPDEIRDCYDFFRHAQGRVLINGLGLGVVLDVILHKLNEDGTPAVTEVIVVEKDFNVFSLVSPTFFKDKRVQVIIADALEYKPEGKFGAVWNDIWDNISSENLPDMHKLHRKYGRRASWQGSWCREECDYAKRRWR